MSTIRPSRPKITPPQFIILAAIGALAVALSIKPGLTAGAPFGPANPFYAPSTLPFQAPPFDKIKDGDYQPAIEAGMAEQRKEMQDIANNPAAPAFENTIAAMERSEEHTSELQSPCN